MIIDIHYIIIVIIYCSLVQDIISHHAVVTTCDIIIYFLIWIMVTNDYMILMNYDITRH